MLCTSLLYLSLERGAPLLDLALALVQLGLEVEPRDGEHDRDGQGAEELEPVPP